MSVVRWRDGHGGGGCSRGWPRLRGDGRAALDVEAGEGTSHKGSAEEDAGGRAAPHGRCVGWTARRDGGRRHSKAGGGWHRSIRDGVSPATVESIPPEARWLQIWRHEGTGQASDSGTGSTRQGCGYSWTATALAETERALLVVGRWLVSAGGCGIGTSVSACRHGHGDCFVLVK
ncbi:pollen-specific leucine-rich repeat extensin-like protein 4 [Iris pallida]|uniref:Pollen-specific leucine-rich repeat extensin-like protein 4 n=1 Tax=Iris pallida TaxID=29817 RepID=A0AAX6EA57_IRIPA|nr:pollen-specific leucine-rich repeat extensin-like protein 4 [Iris pallida]